MSELARVVYVLNDGMKVVINRGIEQGVKVGDRYLIYALGEEMIDPETEESLGRLEVVKGRGKVVHVQEKMATVESIEKFASSKTITKRKNNNSYFFTNSPYTEEVMTDEPELKAFINPRKSDYAKPIS